MWQPGNADAFEHDALVLAMVDPLYLVAIGDVERTAGRTVQTVAATPSEITAAIKPYSQDA